MRDEEAEGGCVGGEWDGGVHACGQDDNLHEKEGVAFAH